MYLQIRTCYVHSDKFGPHIQITKLGCYNDDGTFIKWVKLNTEVVELMKGLKF